MYLVRPPYLLKKIYPNAIWRKDTSQKKIYLTFDDGPVTLITPWVLDVLKKQEIKATFFCVGENVVKHPEIYQRILSEGHTVGNHTFNHLDGWKMRTSEYIQNIEKCAAVVNSKLFRPPYGRIKKSQISSLSERSASDRSLRKESFGHYSVIMWDVLSGDYDKNTTPEKCLQNVCDAVRNGSIIVFHDSNKAQKNLEYALPRFIEYAKANGFEFDVL